MRLYEIATGKNKGCHYIFDSVKEAREITGISDIEGVNWKEGRTGEWVRTDDGYIVQILEVYNLSNFGGKGKERFTESKTTGHWIGSKSVKVCFGVYTVYGKKNGDIVSNKMIATPHRIEDYRKNRVSITAKNTILGKYLTKKKRAFVYHLAQSGNPIAALRAVLPKNIPYLAKTKIYEKALELMKDKYVIKELNTYMINDDKKVTFKTNLRAALAIEGLNEADFAKELKEGLSETRKGSLAHKQWVEMYGKVLSFVGEDSEELIPDRLPQKTNGELDYNANVLLPPEEKKSN